MLFLSFFDLLRPKFKIENKHLFAKKNCIVFSSILQNDGPKSKFFCKKMETKHPLN